MTDLLGIKADLFQAIDLAAQYGFGAVDTRGALLAAPNLNAAQVRDQMARAGVRPGYVSLSPGRVPVPEPDWQAALAELPRVAQAAQSIGFRRTALVVLPFHETLPFDQAFAQHVRRLNEMMAVLDEYGIALALEYVSPISRRAPYPHAFVHDMKAMLHLCSALNSPNVGLLLDSFHWHCAGESLSEITRLDASQVVVVHINDAPNVPLDDQVVGERALPGATGVIDTAGFIGALQTIGYDGPVTCEPMASALAVLPQQADEAILAQVSAAMDAVLPSRFLPLSC